MQYGYLRFGLEKTVEMLDAIKDLGFTLRHPGRHLHRHRRPGHPRGEGQAGDGRAEGGARRREAVPRRRHHQRRALQQGHRHLVHRHREGRGRDVQGDGEAGQGRRRVQPDLHHGRLGRPRLQAADPPAGRHARPDGAPVRRDHREPDHLELPRRAHRAAVLHLDPRRPQGPGGHRAEDGGLRLPDAPPGGRQPGRDHLRARLHAPWTASTSGPSSSRARSSSPCATASSAGSAWRTSRTRSAARSSCASTRRSPRRRPTPCRPRASRRSASAPCSPARASAACAPSATAATSPPASWWRWAWRWASSPPSPSASRAPSSPCARSTSAARPAHRTEQTTLEAKNNGAVKFHNINTVKNKKGDLVVMNRAGALVIHDQKGRERERHAVVYGATLKVKDGQDVKQGQLLVEWDPYSFTILTEEGGAGRLQGRHRGPDRPRAGGREHRDVGAGHHGVVGREEAAAHRDQGREGQDAPEVPAALGRPPHGGRPGRGVTPATCWPRSRARRAKTKDITGGLPRVVELFEARRPKEPAVITEIDGVGEVRRRGQAAPQDLRDRRTTTSSASTSCPAAPTSTCRKASG